MARQYGSSMVEVGTSGGDPRTLPREIYALRRSRDAIFPRLFGDPAWDIVLYLYECHRDGWPATRAVASDASRTPPAVGARFLTALIHEGLIRPALGSEETHVELTEEGLVMMERWLVEVASAIKRCTGLGPSETAAR